MTEKFYSLVKGGARFIALTLALLSLAVTSHAQSTQVKGSVKDVDGNALLGVTVIAVGTSTGVTTSLNGEYTLNVPAGATELRFSYIGYEDMTVTIGSQTTIDVVMRETTTEIDEIVVNIGYGVQRKRDLTGPVSSVNSKVLESMPVTSTAAAIQGRMPGVNITTSEGSPDAEVKIRIRGGGSVTQDNSPLYIVDGFPVNSISDIAPNDIETIDVLKDASSTAIYGARGANGVIIITTKSGKEGKATVSFNTYWGVKKVTKTLDVLNPSEFVLWQYEIAKRGDASATSSSMTKHEEYFGVWDDMDIYGTMTGTDWQDEIFGRTAFQQYYNLSVTGGSEGIRYNIGLTHNDEEGVMMNSGFVRDNITAKINGKLSKMFSFEFNPRFSRTVVDGAGLGSGSTNSYLKHAIKYAPISGIVSFDASDEDDEEQATTNFYNPVDLINDDYKQVTRMTQTYNGAVLFKPVSYITVRSEWGAEFGNERTDRYQGPNTSIARNNEGKPVASIETKDSHKLRTANTVTFDKTGLWGGNHNITVLLGQEAQTYSTKKVLSEARKFPNGTNRKQALAMMERGEAEPVNTTVAADNNYLSYFGRLNWSGWDKYLFSFSMRADASSKFAPGNRWGYFPSAAVAWRLSEEKFMESTRSWMNSLKVRFSYGLVGNDRIGDDMWQQLYTTSAPSSKYYHINNNQVSHLVPDPNTGLPNRNLKWESTLTRDIGLDVGLFGGRVNIVFDVYRNTTKDLLLNAKIPASTGYPTQMQNIGETLNKGLELAIDGTIVSTKDFNLTAAFNIGFNRGKIVDLGTVDDYTVSSYWYSGGRIPDADFLVAKGRPIGLIYGYVTDGYYTFDDFDFDETNKRWTLKNGVPNNSSLTSPSDFAPGALKFKKLGEVNSQEDWVINGDDDRTVIGNTNPKHTGGFAINGQWKNLDFGLFFNWSYGNDVYNANKLEFSSYPDTRLYGNILNTFNSSNRFSYINRQTGESMLYDPAALAAYNANATMWSPVHTTLAVHSWAVEDGSFLRLNNVTIGYTLPEKWTKKATIQKVRVYVTGYNLYTWTSYTGYDPEVDSRRSTPLTPGVDYSAYPRARSFVAGINLTF